MLTGALLPQTNLLKMLRPLAKTLMTFVLHWNRTSIPFDRVLPDDGLEDLLKDPALSRTRTSRAETFAHRVAEQMPFLR